MHSELLQAIQGANKNPATQVGGYLQVLIERFGLIERRLPVFARPQAKRGRYYVTDNFLGHGWRRWPIQFQRSRFDLSRNWSLKPTSAWLVSRAVHWKSWPINSMRNEAERASVIFP
mgnify:CR=1 FL=1